MGDMCEGIGRMFTPSDSDGSGMVAPAAAGSSSAAAVASDTGAAKSFESVETMSANRRLARLSKYFTSPVGVLDSNTGSTGTF